MIKKHCLLRYTLLMSGAPIKSAERTLVLFELFAAKQRPLSVTEIATAMGMPQSSTSVLVKSLVTLAYLEHNPTTRKYYPTPRIAFLSAWMPRRHQATGKLPQLFSQLAEETGESAFVAMRNGINAQYLFAQIGADPLRLHVESGHLYPLACTATGYALLSRENDVEIGKIIRRTQVESSNEYWRETAAECMENVQFVREQGYAMSDGQTVRGAGAISILLPSTVGSVPLAAAVGGPMGRLREKKQEILAGLRGLSKRVTAKALAGLVDEVKSA